MMALGNEEAIMARIPMTNNIKAFLHCKTCIENKPKGISPADYQSIECGWTDIGIQVWCKRCQLNIIHIDFEGQRHPANLDAIPHESDQQIPPNKLN